MRRRNFLNGLLGTALITALGGFGNALLALFRPQPLKWDDVYRLHLVDHAFPKNELVIWTANPRDRFRTRFPDLYQTDKATSSCNCKRKLIAMAKDAVSIASEHNTEDWPVSTWNRHLFTGGFRVSLEGKQSG